MRFKMHFQLSRRMQFAFGRSANLPFTAVFGRTEFLTDLNYFQRKEKYVFFIVKSSEWSDPHNPIFVHLKLTIRFS
jgi:hypothetical protein